MDFADFNCQRDQIFGIYGKQQKDIDSYLDILKEWMRHQHHLPIKSISDEFLEINLLKSKFSVEKTKRKIEGYCTFKIKMLDKYIPNCQLPQLLHEPQCYIPMPKLTSKFHRIIFGKVFDEENYEMKRDLVNSLILREFLSRFDYNDGEIYVMDFTQCSSTFLTKFRANVVMDVTTLTFEGHSARIKEIHVIGKYVSAIIGLVKPFLPAKLLPRIIAHRDITSLAGILPVECLPQDYGGKLKSLEEMRADMNEMYKIHNNHLVGYLRTMSNEELRIGGPKSDECHGTFRMLNID